jgi:hypothetical protein
VFIEDFIYSIDQDWLESETLIILRDSMS